MKKLDLLFLSLVCLFFFQCKSDDDAPWAFDPQKEVYGLIVEQVEVDARHVHLAAVNLSNGKINEFSDEKIHMTGLSGFRGFQTTDLEGGRYFLARNYDLLVIDLATGITLFNNMTGHFRGVQFNGKTKKLYGIFLNLTSSDLDKKNMVMEINPETGDTTLIGYLPFANFTGIYQDIDTDNNSLIAYEHNQEQLYSFDLSTGESSSVHVPSLKGIQFNPNDGKVYAIEQLANDDGFVLVTINIDTGQTTKLFSALPFKAIYAEGIQTLHRESNSYVVWGWGFDDELRLFSIDVSTGEEINSPKVRRQLWGIQN